MFYHNNVYQSVCHIYESSENGLNVTDRPTILVFLHGRSWWNSSGITFSRLPNVFKVENISYWYFGLALCGSRGCKYMGKCLVSK